MKIVKTLAVSALAVVTMAAMAQSDQAIRIVIDGNQVQFDNTQPTEINGRVLVPLRGIFEKLGASVDWNSANQTITARKNGQRVRITIGQSDAFVNGQTSQLDVPPTLVGGVTMVPLRFVSEALGGFVSWNQSQQEVDVTSLTAYNLPLNPPPTAQTPPPPPVPVAPPPPVIIQAPAPPVEIRPLRIVKTYDEIRADTVIPFSLDSRLSSRDSKPGDPFTATLETRGHDHYLSLPQGTQAYGTIVYVKRQHRREPGIVQIRFDHLLLPNGRTVPVNGQLIGLDDLSVMRDQDGELRSKGDQRGSTSAFLATGEESAMVVAFPTRRPLQDGMIGGMLQTTLDANQRARLARELDLHRGTPMGLRLYDNLVIPKSDK